MSSIYGYGDGYYSEDFDGPDFAADRRAAAEWAAGILADPAGVCLLDSETTGLTSTDQLVELAVVDLDGKPLFHSRFRPTCPISAGASAVHGLYAGNLVDAPRFADSYTALCDALAGRLIVVYNASYDRMILGSTCDAFGLTLPPCKGWTCLMQQYSAFVGWWSDRHQSYTWQKLPGGDHTALGDARAALAVLQTMAADVAPTEEATA